VQYAYVALMNFLCDTLYTITLTVHLVLGHEAGSRAV
jgi:hypothetical protein